MGSEDSTWNLILQGLSMEVVRSTTTEQRFSVWFSWISCFWKETMGHPKKKKKKKVYNKILQKKNTKITQIGELNNSKNRPTSKLPCKKYIMQIILLLCK